jgi:uncharacterized protein DUF4326
MTNPTSAGAVGLDDDRARALVAAYDRIVEQPHLMCALGELRGRDLACWCPIYPPGEPFLCHADYLLWLANHEGELV